MTHPKRKDVPSTAKPKIADLRRNRPFGDVRKFNRAVGRRLVQMRVAYWGTARLTAAQHAEIYRVLHVPYPSWKSWENGGRSLSLQMADRIGYAFNVDPIWILYGQGEMRSYPDR